MSVRDTLDYCMPCSQCVAALLTYVYQRTYVCEVVRNKPDTDGRYVFGEFGDSFRSVRHCYHESETSVSLSECEYRNLYFILIDCNFKMGYQLTYQFIFPLEFIK